MKRSLSVGISLMLCSAIITATGQAFWKFASHGIHSWQLYVGFICYGIGAVVMTVAFRFGSLSVLHPMLSIGYIVSIFIGIGFLHEHVTAHQVFGDLVIVIGAVLMGIGGKREATGM